MISTLQDLFKKDIQNIFQGLNSNFGMNFVIVFDLKNQNIVSLYVCQNILVPDEQNRKTFLVKGKLLDLENILQTTGIGITNSGLSGNIKQYVDSLPNSLHTFSENMFGFICFGVQGY